MIITVEKLRQYIDTNLTDEMLEEKLQALEVSIRNYTNNNFQNIFIRFLTNSQNGVLQESSKYMNVGDTVQISKSSHNDGLYVIVDKTEDTITLDRPLYDEYNILVTKIEYPSNVKMGVIEIMRWKLNNEHKNYDPTAEKDVQSESISRHSVTYAKDATESDLDVDFGVPRKYVFFLKKYMKARF